MKSCKICWAITTLLAIAVGFIGFQFVTGSTEETDDGRTAIIMTSAERDFILGEMRVFLETVQTIVEAVADDDMAAVAQAATAVGMISTGGESAQLIAKLPLDFKTLGMGTHKAFDDLAQEANDMGDTKVVLANLGELMLRCTSCHAGYRFDVAEEGS